MLLLRFTSIFSLFLCFLIDRDDNSSKYCAGYGIFQATNKILCLKPCCPIIPNPHSSPATTTTTTVGHHHRHRHRHRRYILPT
ncbi:hypothetical protein L6452_01053 [Arctium lappa]|uniref:Uncharacterized protein n=1 Tax=Arctium lappa TaxID=4217 RepID=A0ACB9FGL4_ARCLA|nr:hypothetical protein L6452_01053 [Arctium lappa]